MRIFTLGVAIGLSLLANSAFAGFVIDDYSDAQTFPTDGTTSPPQNINLIDLPTTADRSGTRTVTGADNADSQNQFEVFVGINSIFRANQQSSATLNDATYSLMYDNFGTGTIDLLDGGANEGFIFRDFSYTNSGGGDLEFTINVTTTLSSSSLTISQPKNKSVQFISFASFAPAFDFTDVTSIELVAMIPGGGDQTQLQFDSFEVGVVPEPASMAIMGLGGLLAGCGVARRRRKQVSELVY